MSESTNAAPHPLLVVGDAKTGWIFVNMLSRLPLTASQRAARGFDTASCNAIEVGEKPVTKEAILQLLFDFYTSFPKEAKPGTAEYLLLKSIANGSWGETGAQHPQDRTITAEFLKSSPVSPDQLRQEQASRTVTGSRGIGSGPVQRATIIPEQRPTATVTSEMKPVAVNRMPSKPLPRIVVGEPKVASFEEGQKQKRKSVPQRPWGQPAPRANTEPSKPPATPIRRDVAREQDTVTGDDVFVGDDYFLIKGKGIPFNSEIRSRFWVNLVLVQREQSISVQKMLSELDMPQVFFAKLQAGEIPLTSAMAMRFSKALKVSIVRLLK